MVTDRDAKVTRLPHCFRVHQPAAAPPLIPVAPAFKVAPRRAASGGSKLKLDHKILCDGPVETNERADAVEDKAGCCLVELGT